MNGAQTSREVGGAMIGVSQVSRARPGAPGRVDTLKEVKQVQLQILELQASLQNVSDKRA